MRRILRKIAEDDFSKSRRHHELDDRPWSTTWCTPAEQEDGKAAPETAGCEIGGRKISFAGLFSFEPCPRSTHSMFCRYVTGRPRCAEGGI